jgi:glycosyltransferase involved in cell wall biosynthesis
MSNLVENGLAEGVNSLNPPEIAAALSKATKKTYSKISERSSYFLSWEQYSDKIISVYNKLLEEL